MYGTDSVNEESFGGQDESFGAHNRSQGIPQSATWFVESVVMGNNKESFGGHNESLAVHNR